MRFSRRWKYWLWSCRLWHCIIYSVVTNVLDEHIVPIFRLILNPEDGGNKFLWYTGNELHDYTVLQPRRPQHIRYWLHSIYIYRRWLFSLVVRNGKPGPWSEVGTRALLLVTSSRLALGYTWPVCTEGFLFRAKAAEVHRAVSGRDDGLRFGQVSKQSRQNILLTSSVVFQTFQAESLNSYFKQITADSFQIPTYLSFTTILLFHSIISYNVSNWSSNVKCKTGNVYSLADTIFQKHNSRHITYIGVAPMWSKVITAS